MTYQHPNSHRGSRSTMNSTSGRRTPPPPKKHRNSGSTMDNVDIMNVSGDNCTSFGSAKLDGTSMSQDMFSPTPPHRLPVPWLGETCPAEVATALVFSQKITPTKIIELGFVPTFTPSASPIRGNQLLKGRSTGRAPAIPITEGSDSHIDHTGTATLPSTPTPQAQALQDTSAGHSPPRLDLSEGDQASSCPTSQSCSVTNTTLQTTKTPHTNEKVPPAGKEPDMDPAERVCFNVTEASTLDPSRSGLSKPLQTTKPAHDFTGPGAEKNPQGTPDIPSEPHNNSQGQEDVLDFEIPTFREQLEIDNIYFHKSVKGLSQFLKTDNVASLPVLHNKLLQARARATMAFTSTLFFLHQFPSRLSTYKKDMRIISADLIKVSILTEHIHPKYSHPTTAQAHKVADKAKSLFMGIYSWALKVLDEIGHATPEAKAATSASETDELLSVFLASDQPLLRDHYPHSSTLQPHLISQTLLKHKMARSNPLRSPSKMPKLVIRTK